jgi:hypothetical protein
MMEKELTNSIYLQTNDIPADTLTKALLKPKAANFRIILGQIE